jgi:hypothetical protein
VEHVLGLHGRAEVAPEDNVHNPAAGLVAKEAPPDVTFDQEQRAVTIIHRSPAFRALFGATKYGITRYGYWTSGGPTNVSLGVTVWLTLSHAVTVTGQWPHVQYAGEGSSVPAGGGSSVPYRARLLSFTATGLRSVAVLVDLGSNVVAGITPVDYHALRR